MTLSKVITQVSLGLVSLATLTVPVTATPHPDIIINASVAQETVTNQDIILPQSTALLVTFPDNMIVDVGQGDSAPIILPLMQDIKSPSGEIVIPANTPISVKVQPYQDGALLVAESIILNGQMIPINAHSSMLPGRTITRRTAEEMARQGSKVYGNLATSIGGAVGAAIPNMQRGGFGGAAFGIIKGMSSPDNIRVVEINAGRVHLLQLQSSLELTSR
ncbi:hypothetical protein [Cyanothece sp. BG0011]|uniref:hypothetical protein n=1 Tax=Cyanothece sp. BG0011 TaxID=2082950 RepID=UPI000D1FB852|nr:hypothetical protein [Cyanothece sp. BG0011]